MKTGGHNSRPNEEVNEITTIKKELLDLQRDKIDSMVPASKLQVLDQSTREREQESPYSSVPGSKSKSQAA
jgi:hypothetical protein